MVQKVSHTVSKGTTIMTGPGQQTPHTLSKDRKMVDQVKAQLVKGFVLAAAVCDHVSGSSKRMVVSC